VIKLVLDTNVLGKLCHPRAEANRPLVECLRSFLFDPQYRLVLPEIADYECRRVLIWRGQLKKVPEALQSLARLDELRREIEFLPLDSNVMLLAADFWAKARAEGLEVDHEKGLSADLILAAQVSLCTNAQVVTENRKHLARFVTVFPLHLYIN
jgi:predicted nucleic acid-binding protein